MASLAPPTGSSASIAALAALESSKALSCPDALAFDSWPRRPPSRLHHSSGPGWNRNMTGADTRSHAIAPQRRLLARRDPRAEQFRLRMALVNLTGSVARWANGLADGRWAMRECRAVRINPPFAAADPSNDDCDQLAEMSKRVWTRYTICSLEMPRKPHNFERSSQGRLRIGSDRTIGRQLARAALPSAGSRPAAASAACQLPKCSRTVEVPGCSGG